MGNCWVKFFGDMAYYDDYEPEFQLASGNVQLIKTMESWEAKLSEANKDGKILVANFSAPWCNPCQKIKKTYVEIADKYPSIVFLTVDVDELGELGSKWGIKATPTFFFLKEGRTIDKLVGANEVDLINKTAGVTDLKSMLPPPQPHDIDQ